jgi:predicted nucleotidyltransferase
MKKEDILNSCAEFVNKINKKFPVEIAYLFGSMAKNTENSMSDIDIALLFKKDYTAEDDVFIRGELMEMGIEFFKIPVDIISLNKASLSLKYEVVKDGKILLESSPSGRVIFEALVLREYLDFKYYSDMYNKTILNSIRKNNFFGG